MTPGKRLLPTPLDHPRAASDSRSAPSDLLVVLPATPVSASLVRQRTRAWLDALSWPPLQADDLVVAVNEAVANVIDHAYRDRPEPGDVHVYAWSIWEGTGSGSRRIVVAVTDHGRWRPLPADPGHRGRGLPMIRACTDSVLIERAAGGTSVIMSSTAPASSA
jgi:anti-sigma regulatory factor (Ser/Thr protein kinase)